MKKLLLILTLLFSAHLYASVIEIDERINDIYYLNGKLVTEDNAENTLFKVIRQAVKKDTYANNESAMLKETNYKLLYNQTFGFYADVLEAFNQKKAEHKYFWITIDAIINIAGKTTKIGIVTDAAKKQAARIIAKEILEALKEGAITYGLEAADQEQLKNIISALESYLKGLKAQSVWSAINAVSDILKERDLSNQFYILSNGIASGHQAIIIAHSEGNFFANELDAKFDRENKSWMKRYVKAISVSSPAENASFGGSHITYSNDPTIAWPDRVKPDTSNPLHYRRFILQYGYNETLAEEDAWRLIDEVESMSMPDECGFPLGFYFADDISDLCYNNESIALFEMPSVKFHDFEYYMQENLVSDIETVRPNPSREYISNFLSDSIKTFRTAPSQWEVKKKNNCPISCRDKLGGIEHKYSKDMNNMTLDTQLPVSELEIYPFSKDSKLYPLKSWSVGNMTLIDNGIYVKSSKVEAETLVLGDNLEEDGICYELRTIEDYKPAKLLDTIKKDDVKEPTTPASGYIEVSLVWEDTDIDMDLQVNFPSGEHDVQDECQPMEHFYILNDKYVTPGLYPVYIRYKTDEGVMLNQTVKEMQNIVVTIKVPGSTEARTVNLKTIDSLANGHIADIKVEERKVEVVLQDDFQRSSTVLYYRPETGYVGSSGGYSGGYTGGGGSSGSWGYIYEPPTTKDYIYSIIWHISQALLGPLAGANISIYALEDYNLNTNKGSNPIYSDTSSYGSSIYTAGVINIPREIMDSLDDEKLYIVEAKGGMDVDANDDKVFDASPVTNYGAVRAISSGSMFKNTGFKVNILTEMAYQISKKYYNAADISKLTNKSDEAVKCLLNSDINLDNVTNTIDALYFTPYSDMDKLHRNYRNEFLPVVSKLHKGEDIYEDSFKLYARPLVKGGYFSVNEDAPTGTIIGKIETDCVSESPVHLFSLSGAGAENFEVDTNGNLKVAKRLVYEERRIYSLSVTGINSYGSSPASAVYITVTADNSPVITNTLTAYVFENMPDGSLLGTISVNNMGYPITAMRLEGYGAEYFNIDNDGKITVAHGENISVQDREYSLMATAENAFGQSAPSSVKFGIYDDTPVILNDLYITIREDIAKNTTMGKPSYYHGLSTVKEFTLEGYGAENFDIGTDGTIKISQNADIKLEDSPYRLSIYARNEQGVGNTKSVTVNVISLAVINSISLYDFSTNIYVSANNNSVIGKIAYSYGYTPPNAFTLSGAGSERFSINSNGVITLTDNRNLNAGEVFNLEANASNEYASSGKSQVKITVIDDTPHLYNFGVSIMEGLEAETAIGKVGYSYGVLPIVSFELEGADAAYFTIDSSGVIRIKEGVIINYDVKNLYTFTIKGINSIGKTAESSAVVTVINDAPVIRSGTFNIMENSYGGEYVGRVGIVSNGKSVIESFTLSGSGAEHFTIDKNGDIKTAIGSLIDYETKSVYNLKATARNAHDTSNEANIAINVINAPDQEPVLIPTTLSIDENSPNGTYIGNMGIYAHGHSTITSFVITGTNSDWFSIDNTGKITVTDLAKLDYESKKIFNLKVKAMSSYGESTLVDLTININNVPDLPPVIQSSSYRFYINENSPAETLVGQLNINSNDSPVTSVVLSGTGSENFKAYNNGTIVVAEEAKLDYESVNRYYLSAKAVNAFGESNTVNVYIYLNNVQDNPPIISSYYYNFDVDENSPAETLVWQLNINDDGSPVTSVVLSGDGNEHFKVYNNGTIVVAEGAKLDYESKNYYYLSIKAVNAFGESNTVSFYIYIKNLKDTLPVLQDTNFNTYRKTPANKTIGVITTILSECGITEYVSDDSSVFGVRTNGEVYTKTAVQEDNIYTIHVYAKSLCGDSNTIKLTIDTQSRIIVSINDSYIAESIALSSDNTKAFVGDYGSLKIFNVSDPAKPELISSIGTSYHAYSVALSSDETKAFVGDSSSLKIFNVSDPAKPELISQINIDYATAVALSSDNTKAFVGDYGSLKIFNVSDPTKPELIGSIGASDSVEVIVLSSDETKAFVGDSRSFKIIDIEDFTKE